MNTKQSSLRRRHLPELAEKVDAVRDDKGELSGHPDVGHEVGTVLPHSLCGLVALVQFVVFKVLKVHGHSLAGNFPLHHFVP